MRKARETSQNQVPNKYLEVSPPHTTSRGITGSSPAPPLTSRQVWLSSPMSCVALLPGRSNWWLGSPPVEKESSYTWRGCLACLPTGTLPRGTDDKSFGLQSLSCPLQAAYYFFLNISDYMKFDIFYIKISNINFLYKNIKLHIVTDIKEEIIGCLKRAWKAL